MESAPGLRSPISSSDCYTITNYNEGNHYSLSASALVGIASFAFAGRSGMKAAQGSCFVAGTPVVPVSSHVAQVQLAAEPPSGSGRPGWSVTYVGIFAGLTASAAARDAARRQRRRTEDVEREARGAVFGEVERHRESRSGLLAESLLEDARWFEQDIPKAPDKTFDVVFGRGQWAAAVPEAMSGMDDFLDSSTQPGTGAARPVAGTPESARPAVLGASGPCVLSDSDYDSERTLRFPAGAEKASRDAAPPSPRSAHDNAARSAAAKPRRLAHSRPNGPPAARCRPWLWNAASILSLAVALVCLAFIPPFNAKSAVAPEQTTLTTTTNGTSLPTIAVFVNTVEHHRQRIGQESPNTVDAPARFVAVHDGRIGQQHAERIKLVLPGPSELIQQRVGLRFLQGKILKEAQHLASV